MISIGLPVYNAAPWLKECLDSIVAQCYKDWELIVTIDDGLGIMDYGLEIRDERIKVIADGKHLGISARINQQVAMARGELFARMDADDVMLPNRLAIQVEYMQQHPEVDVCGTSAGEWTFVHPSVMGRTAWFRKHLYRSECDGCEDWDLWTRTRSCSQFGFIEEQLIIYRQPEKRDKKKYLQRRRQGRIAIRLNKPEFSCFDYYRLLADSYMKSVFAWLCW